MTNRYEQLSALYDNELPTEELHTLMQDLKRDPLDDAERLRRYRLAGDVMRKELDAASFMDISAAVARAIEQEPAANVIRPARWRKPAWMASVIRPVTGLAVAASVAMVTVTGVRLLADYDTRDNPVAAPQMAANVAPVNPVVANNVRVVSDAQLQKAQAQPLTEYMLRHSGYAGQATMQGMIPYARVVSVETDAH
jgi:sigma-E factor negative regulatory protein RseA